MSVKHWLVNDGGGPQIPQTDSLSITKARMMAVMQHHAGVTSPLGSLG
jgi:hypothetical protein